jgi:hypothetical protein
MIAVNRWRDFWDLKLWIALAQAGAAGSQPIC